MRGNHKYEKYPLNDSWRKNLFKFCDLHISGTYFAKSEIADLCIFSKMFQTMIWGRWFWILMGGLGDLTPFYWMLISILILLHFSPLYVEPNNAHILGGPPISAYLRSRIGYMPAPSPPRDNRHRVARLTKIWRYRIYRRSERNTLKITEGNSLHDSV